MAFFDELIADLGSRPGLGPKAEALLRALIGLIEDNPDGLGGFLNQFKKAGFSDQVASWLGGGAGAALSGPDVETALGGGPVAAIADRLGLESGTVAEAIGAILPRLVGALTPDGTIPKLLPTWALDLPGGAPPTPRAAAKPIAAAPPASPARNKAALWAVPLVILAGIGLALVLPHLRKAPPPAEAPKAEAPAPAPEPAPPQLVPSAAPAPAPRPVPAPAPTAPARLKLDRAGGVVTYGGSVDSAARRDSIVALLKARFGADHINGELSVDPAIAPPVWLDSLKPALDLFKAPGWRAAFDGSSLDVGAPAPDRDRLIAGLKAIYGPAMAVSAAPGASPAAGKPPAGADDAAAALAGLKPGFSGKDLVAILNKYAIAFDPGGATLPEASKPVLRQAAALIQKLPPGAKLQIDGYADAQGDAAANGVLSRRRAEAVRALLVEAGAPPAVLKVKSHTAAPQGDRRIAFSVK